MDQAKIKAALEALKSEDAAAAMQLLEDMLVAAASGGEPEADAAEMSADEEAPEDDAAVLSEVPEEEPEEEMALSRIGRVVLTATGRTSADGAAAEAERLIKLGRAHENFLAEVEEDKRRDAIARLIKLGVETPATAWVGDAEDRKPAKHLTAETPEELLARVEKLEAAGSRAKTPPVTAATEMNDNEVRLSQNMTPEQRARFLARRSKK